MDRNTRKAYRQLSRMSDRMLADIGMSRADIPTRLSDHQTVYTFH